MELVGLNTKYYRYQQRLTQEQYANKTKFKIAYISTIETGDANLTCKNIDSIAESLGIKPADYSMKKLQNLLKNYHQELICINNL